MFDSPGIGSRIDLDAKKAEIASGELFAQIKQYFDSEYLLGAGSPSGSDTDTSDRGIVQGTVGLWLHVLMFDGLVVCY